MIARRKVSRHSLNNGTMRASDVMIGGADTRMWTRVALSISVILVLVCSLPIVTPSAPCRRMWRVSRRQTLKASCPDRHGWRGELGKDGQRQAPGGWLCPPRWSLCRFWADFEFGLRHLPPALRDVGFQGCSSGKGAGSDARFESVARVNRHRSRPAPFPPIQDKCAHSKVLNEARPWSPIIWLQHRKWHGHMEGCVGCHGMTGDGVNDAPTLTMLFECKQEAQDD